jgi:hypothetical protein
MNIEIDDNIVEGTEFAIYLNGKLIESGVCEHDGQVDDLVGQIAVSLYTESLRRKITLTAKPL